MMDFTGHFAGPGAGAGAHSGAGAGGRAPAVSARVLAGLAVLGSLLPGAAAGSPPGPPTLEELMAGLGAMPGLSARFREEKHLTLLREPLVSRGAIYFAPPDRLARWVEEPVPSRLVVDGRGLAYSGDGETGHVPMDSHPMVGLFVHSLRMILGGDLAGLRRLYEIEYGPADAAGPEAWRARLVPLREPLRGTIAELRLRGRGVSVTEFGLVEAGGDETRMVFTDVDTDHRFGPEELALRFGLPES